MKKIKTKKQETKSKAGKKEKITDKKNKWPIVLASLFLLLGVIILIFWLYMRGPTVSQNVRIIEAPVAEKKEAPFKERFKSKYLSFSRLNSYKLKNHEETSGENRILEKAFFAEEGVNSKKIALTVARLESNNLEDVPDYKMRQIYADKYKKSEFNGDGVKAETFSVSEESYFEKIYFIIKGEYLAEIAFTAPFAKNSELEKEADEIAESVFWRE